LLGKGAGERLRTQLFDPKIHPNLHPQSVRNAHLHRGEFHGSEFANEAMSSNFRDPTFDDASREVLKIAKAAIIEWLSRGGVFAMPIRNRKTPWRRWMREHAFTMMALAAAAGLCLGWLFGIVWSE
jgi:hypothetical protein